MIFGMHADKGSTINAKKRKQSAAEHKRGLLTWAFKRGRRPMALVLCDGLAQAWR